MANANPVAARWSWKNEAALMNRLRSVQNHHLFAHQDIMTFAGMCSSTDQLRKHVEACEARAEDR